MGNVKSTHKTNETAAEDVNIDEVDRPIQEPVAPSEDKVLPPFEEDAVVYRIESGSACVWVSANERGREACADLFDAPITWIQLPADELPPDWELARISASLLADEGGHSLVRLAEEMRTTPAGDNEIRLAGGLSRYCDVLLADGEAVVPFFEYLWCPHCRVETRALVCGCNTACIMIP